MAYESSEDLKLRVRESMAFAQRSLLYFILIEIYYYKTGIFESRFPQERKNECVALRRVCVIGSL